MPSNARRAFDQNAQDIRRLMQIHRDIGGDACGRRYGLEVLNKSAIVLITAVWEAYCEDLAAEALEHIVNNSQSATLLPKELKKRISQEIKSDHNEIAMWELADSGWRTKTKGRLEVLTRERSWNLNTPKSENIDKLFLSAIGLSRVSDSWTWKASTPNRARVKLDRYITLRGEIAHRGQLGTSCTLTQVQDYFQHVRRCVSKTGGRVNVFVKEAIGKRLW